jgi:hypothetical protein
MKHLAKLGGVLAALLLLAAPVFAADLTQFPDAGAPGDPVVVRGSGFAESPTVTFGGVEAEVVRSNPTRILCLVPDGLDPGAVRVVVDGTSTGSDFTVLEAGAPVVLHVSADTATPGQRIVLVGRRLGGGTVSFVDADGATQATVDTTGRRHAVTFRVPTDLDAGTYSLVVENGDGVASGDASPTIEIVAAARAELTGADPDGALPGDHLKLTGTDLGPIGPVVVEWTDTAGTTLRAAGLSNGYDQIHTFVPFTAVAGEAYEIVAVLRGGTRTSGVLDYTVGTYGAPVVSSVDPEKAPAGSTIRIRGENLLVAGSKPTVTLTKDGVDTAVRVLLVLPGFRGHDDTIVAVIPSDTADGDYDLTVTVGRQTSDPVSFTVGALELAVSKMFPDHQGPRGAFRPVVILGTGFGAFRDAVKLSVVWDDGTTRYAGEVLFRSDRYLLVAPPGGRKDPLPTGTYTVTVVLDPAGTATTAKAGTYTVN